MHYPHIKHHVPVSASLVLNSEKYNNKFELFSRFRDVASPQQAWDKMLLCVDKCCILCDEAGI